MAGRFIEDRELADVHAHLKILAKLGEAAWTGAVDGLRKDIEHTIHTDPEIVRTITKHREIDQAMLDKVADLLDARGVPKLHQELASSDNPFFNAIRLLDEAERERPGSSAHTRKIIEAHAALTTASSDLEYTAGDIMRIARKPQWLNDEDHESLLRTSEALNRQIARYEARTTSGVMTRDIIPTRIRLFDRTPDKPRARPKADPRPERPR